MKLIYCLVFILAMILVFGSIAPVEGQTSGFVISGADATNTLNTVSSTPLSNLIDKAAPRIVLEFGDANQFYLMVPIPTALDQHITSLNPRVILDYADANAFLPLMATPYELDNLLGLLSPRIAFQFANANRYLEFAYPRELIGDTETPKISNLKISTARMKSSVISWTTNEFADSTVECRTKSGLYPISVSDPLYEEQHSLILTGLQQGIEYFCKVRSKDLSGNLAFGNIFSLIHARKLNYFLTPPIMR